MPFVLSCWLDSLLALRPYSTVDRNIASVALHALLTLIVGAPGTALGVAVSPDDDAHVLGVIVGNPDEAALYWLYVKRNFRRCRVGSRLVDHLFASGTTLEVPWVTRDLRRMPFPLLLRSYRIVELRDRALRSAA